MKTGIRRVVLWVPDWPTNALVVNTPPSAQAATVHGGRIVATTHTARQAGVRRGMRVSTAQYLCPDLMLLAEDPIRDASAFETVAAVFDRVAAHVECLRPGLAWAPAAGPARWIGSEQELAQVLVEAVAEETGVDCQVGIASGTLAACAAARGGVIVPQQDTTDFLQSVQLKMACSLLPNQLSVALEHSVEVLEQLGQTTCGQVSHLGRSALVSRFGSSGQAIDDLTHGRDVVVLGGRQASGSKIVTSTFDPPAECVDVMVLEIRRLCYELAEKLWTNGLNASRLTIDTQAHGGDTRVRTWSGVDCLDVGQLLDRVRWQISGWMDQATVTGRSLDGGLIRVTLEATDLRQGTPMKTLWGQPPSGHQAGRSASRAQSLLGEENVLAPLIQGGFDPRSSAVCAPWGEPTPELASLQGEWEGRVEDPPATILDEPVRVSVRDDSFPSLSVVVDPRGRLSAQPSLLDLPASPALPGFQANQTIPLTLVAGPWPVRGRWWATHSPPRAYLRVGSPGGDLLLVQREGSWWVEGLWR